MFFHKPRSVNETQSVPFTSSHELTICLCTMMTNLHGTFNMVERLSLTASAGSHDVVRNLEDSFNLHVEQTHTRLYLRVHFFRSVSKDQNTCRIRRRSSWWASKFDDLLHRRPRGRVCAFYVSRPAMESRESGCNGGCKTWTIELKKSLDRRRKHVPLISGAVHLVESWLSMRAWRAGVEPWVIAMPAVHKCISNLFLDIRSSLA